MVAHNGFDWDEFDRSFFQGQAGLDQQEMGNRKQSLVIAIATIERISILVAHERQYVRCNCGRGFAIHSEGHEYLDKHGCCPECHFNSVIDGLNS